MAALIRRQSSQQGGGETVAGDVGPGHAEWAGVMRRAFVAADQEWRDLFFQGEAGGYVTWSTCAIRNPQIQTKPTTRFTCTDGSGSTAVALLVDKFDGSFVVANAGDSRCILW